MYRKFHVKNNDGFTLIEIIASIAILGMVIVVFLPIFPQIMSWSNSTDNQLKASNLLSQVTHGVEKNFESESTQKCSNKVTSVMEAGYTYNEGTYHAEMNMSQSIEEKLYGLYRIHIKIYSDETDTSLSDTYMYLTCEGEPNG